MTLSDRFVHETTPPLQRSLIHLKKKSDTKIHVDEPSTQTSSCPSATPKGTLGVAQSDGR